MTAVVYHLATWREDKRTWRTPQEWCDPQAPERAITNLASALNHDPDAASNAHVEAVLATWAHWSLTPDEKTGYFEDYCYAIERLNAFTSGLITWEDVNDRLTCTDKTQAALEQLDTDMNEALSVLLHGRNGGAA